MHKNSASSVSDHATGHGAAGAIQARALFQFGPYAARVVAPGRSMCWVRVGDPVPGSCACRQDDCQVDRLASDLAALEPIPDEEAELQHFLTYFAYRIALDACEGSQRPTALLLGLPAATRTELARERAWQRRRDDSDRGREWAADDR